MVAIALVDYGIAMVLLVFMTFILALGIGYWLFSICVKYREIQFILPFFTPKGGSWSLLRLVQLIQIRFMPWSDALSFQVVDKSEGDGVRGKYMRGWPGVIRPMLGWTVNFEADEQNQIEQLEKGRAAAKL